MESVHLEASLPALRQQATTNVFQGRALAFVRAIAYIEGHGSILFPDTELNERLAEIEGILKGMPDLNQINGFVEELVKFISRLPANIFPLEMQGSFLKAMRDLLDTSTDSLEEQKKLHLRFLLAAARGIQDPNAMLEAISDLMQQPQDSLPQLLNNPESAEVLAALLADFSEHIEQLPLGTDVSAAIPWMQMLCESITEPSARAILIPEIFHVLCAFMKTEPQATSLVFALLEQISQQLRTDGETAREVAAMLRYFSEYVEQLPSDACKPFVGLVKPFIDNIGNSPDARLTQEIFHVLCAFMKTEPQATSLVFALLEQILQQSQTDEETARALPAILGYFSEYIEQLPGDYQALIDPLLRLFDPTHEELALEVLYVVLRLEMKGVNYSHVFDVMRSLLSMLENGLASENYYVVAYILRDFSACVEQSPPNAYDLLIEQMKILFVQLLGQNQLDLTLIYEVFHVFYALAKAGNPEVFGEALNLIFGLPRSDHSSLMVLALADNERAEEVLVTIQNMLECLDEYSSSPKLLAKVFLEATEALTVQMVTLFEQLPPNLFLERKSIVESAFAIWNKLIIKDIPYKEQILGYAIDYAHAKGMYYFSPRWDIWWRILNGDVVLNANQNPEVLSALAKTYLALVKPELVGYVRECTTLPTRLPQGACDACLEVFTACSQKIIIVAEMQQRNQEGNPMETRLKSYRNRVQKQYKSIAGDVFALAYLGYDELGNRDTGWQRHSMQTRRESLEPMPHDERLTTIGIGAKRKDLTELSPEDRLLCIQKVRLEGIPDSVVVIAMGEFFTPDMADTLNLDSDAKIILGALEINRKNMETGLKNISDVQSHSVLADVISNGSVVPPPGTYKIQHEKFSAMRELKHQWQHEIDLQTIGQLQAQRETDLQTMGQLQAQREADLQTMGQLQAQLDAIEGALTSANSSGEMLQAFGLEGAEESQYGEFVENLSYAALGQIIDRACEIGRKEQDAATDTLRKLGVLFKCALTRRNQIESESMSFFG
ncbi:MAG: hypothetical protein LBJ75_04675 [Puniceicoccales bacterium]|jgi:hypothetical protein|nr:hypothetical protein [Puniceicoccales bacterium]